MSMEPPSVAIFDESQYFSDYDDYDDYDYDVSSPKKSTPYKKPLNMRISDAININCINEVIQLFATEVNSSHFENSSYHALLCAGALGNKEICEYLLNKGANLNYSQDMYFPLMAVCSSKLNVEENNLVECVELFLNVGGLGLMNAANSYGVTSLMLACREGYENIVRKFLSYNVNIHQDDNNGWTALFYAINHNRIEVVKLLISSGAKTELEDNRRRTPYDIAFQKGFHELQNVLKPKTEEIDDGNPVVECESLDPLEEIQKGFPGIIYQFLVGLGMENYYPKFLEHNITLDKFLVISYDELGEIGVHFSSHRKMILHGIKRFHLSKWNISSLGLKERNQIPDLIDTLNVLCNITYHITVLRSAISYVNLQAEDDIFVREKDHGNKISECRDYLDFIIKQATQINRYSNTLAEQNKMTLKADSIKLKSKSFRKFKFIMIAAVVAIISWNIQSCIKLFPL